MIRRLVLALTLAAACVVCSGVASYAAEPDPWVVEVGAANTEAGSQWGEGYFVVVVTVTANETRTMAGTTYSISGPHADSVEVRVYPASAGCTVSSASCGEPVLATYGSVKPEYTVTAGSDYTVVLYAAYAGSELNEGGTLCCGGLAGGEAAPGESYSVSGLLTGIEGLAPPSPEEPVVVSLSPYDRSILIGGLAAAGFLTAIGAASLVSRWGAHG